MLKMERICCPTLKKIGNMSVNHLISVHLWRANAMLGGEKWKALHYFISFSTVALKLQIASVYKQKYSLSFIHIRSLIFSRRPFGFWSRSCYNFSLFSNCWPQSIIVLSFFFAFLGLKAISGEWTEFGAWIWLATTSKTKKLACELSEQQKCHTKQCTHFRLQNAVVKSHFFAFNFPCSFSLDLITFFVKLGQSYNIQF